MKIALAQTKPHRGHIRWSCQIVPAWARMENVLADHLPGIEKVS